eukprot:gene4070-52443_t
MGLPEPLCLSQPLSLAGPSSPPESRAPSVQPPASLGRFHCDPLGALVRRAARDTDTAYVG